MDNKIPNEGIQPQATPIKNMVRLWHTTHASSEAKLLDAHKNAAIRISEIVGMICHLLKSNTDPNFARLMRACLSGQELPSKEREWLAGSIASQPDSPAFRAFLEIESAFKSAGIHVIPEMPTLQILIRDLTSEASGNQAH